MREVIAVVALTEPVACKKTEINGNPVLSWRTTSMSWTQKENVINMINPVVPLRIKVQSMLRGKTRDESLISSAISSSC